MTKNERVEILMKELAEISAILNSVKETSPVSKTLVSLAAEKAYYFGRNITMLLNEVEVNTESLSDISKELDSEMSDDFFAEAEVENILLQPEVCYSTRISTNPNDITPWMPNSEAYKEVPTEKKEEKVEDKVVTEIKEQKAAESNEKISAHKVSEEKSKDSLSEHLVDKVKKPDFVEDLIEEAEQKEEPKKENEVQKKAFESLFREHPADAKVTSIENNDIRKLLTLNDRFLFQRELFRGDVGLMNFTYDEINKFETFDEALEYLKVNFRWDSESQIVRDFMTLVERHFTGRIL